MMQLRMQEVEVVEATHLLDLLLKAVQVPMLDVIFLSHLQGVVIGLSSSRGN